MQSNIPPELIEHIDEFIGHQDYAPYVLDGQTAEHDGSEDDWHDVVAVVGAGPGYQDSIHKFTMHPNGDIFHTRLA